MNHSLAQRFYFQCIHTVPGEVDSEGRPLVHGHDYSVVVTLNKPDYDIWITSRDEFKALVCDKVIRHINNTNLDLWLSPATGEKICEKIYSELKDTNIGAYISEIQLDETRKNSFNLKIKKVGKNG